MVSRKIKGFTFTVDNNLYEMRDITHNKQFICSDQTTTTLEYDYIDENNIHHHVIDTSTRPQHLMREF